MDAYNSLLLVVLLIYGLILGSFFNVVGLCVPIKKSFITRRSACPSCGKTLSAFELIPVLSYLMQGGKCRGCKVRISPLYPIIELLTGILFVLAALVIGWHLELMIAWTLISMLIVITVSDIRYMLIPDKILLVFSGIFLMERMFNPLAPWWDSILGAVVGFSLLLVIAIVSKGGMGGGDIKLFAVIGFVVGTKTVLLSFFLATLFGAIIGLIGILCKIVKKEKPIPFGPFIAIGTLCAYFFYNDIIRVYLQLLLRH